MSTATEVTALLDGTAAEVARRVAELEDGRTLMALHSADRGARARPQAPGAIFTARRPSFSSPVRSTMSIWYKTSARADASHRGGETTGAGSVR